MKCKTAFLLCCLLILQLFSSQVYAQTLTVSGRVTNKSTGEGLANATVALKGTRTAIQTDANGNFSLSAPAGSVLTVSFIGMAQQEVTVTAAATTINIELEPLPNSMDEVVVIGYGTQKRSVVTGAISSIKARDLENVPSNRVEQALQGRVSGVTIAQNSGQPGSPSTIRIRGLTTFGDGGNNPLWVIDGVVVDQGGIGYLNQSDIESIEVLKDAASAAIYGTRAATGVILVTTKKGKAGKFTVSYNGFYGISSPARKLDLLNASQYASVMNERAVNDGGNLIYADPNSLGTGTDWQDVIFNNSAKRYSHEISLSGGSDKSTFYFSAGIQDQQGIVATEISNYTRKNIRLNSTHKISRIFTFGEAVGYSRQKSVGLGNTNSEYGGPLSSAINLDPITPLVITDPAVAGSGFYLNKGIIRDANGNPYGISTRVGQEMTNPLAYMQTRLGGFGWSDDFVGNAYLEAAIPAGNIGNFKVRSSLGGKLAYWGGQGFTPVFYLSPTVNNIIRNSYNKTNNNSFNWNVENTLTYSKDFGNHDFTVLLGQGAYVENKGGSSSNTIYNLPISSYKDASFRFNIPQSDRESGTSDLIEHKLSSLFARVNYNYDDKYLFTGIIRRDGSSRFGLNKKYGTFPGVSLGWNVSNEDFWKGNNIVSRLKLRANYGVVGNDAIREFGYASIIAGGYNYTLGYPTQSIITGYAPLSLDNPDLHWEETSQADIGFEALLLKNLTVNFDVYRKKTTGILRPIVIPGYVGVSDLPVGNVATMQNSGVELELSYRRTFGQVNFSVNGNVAYLKNEVTYVAADTNFISGDASFQTMGAITRTQVGQPYNSFFGYKSDGVFQNQAEIDAHRNKDNNLIQPNAKPGDFRWLDLNGDGRITNDNLDKTFLGNNFPKYTFGLTLNMDYKGFDFMVFLQGSAGSKIFQGLRRLDIGNANFQTRVLGRWTGDGTTNELPRLTAADPNGNYSRMSDFYLEKGDYTRVKLVQLGYSMPAGLINKIGASRVRVYITAENLFTITGYTGYDPEIGGQVLGVDRGVYPQARSIIGGIQIQF
ncbi:MAG TPA: TonB-dependent receptor [Chitinophagaceae bacterium]